MFSCAEVAGSFWGNLCEDHLLCFTAIVLKGGPLVTVGGSKTRMLFPLGRQIKGSGKW